MPLLSSSGVPVPFTGDLFTRLRDSRALLGDPGGLRRRLLADGVVYLRGMLERAEVLRLRRAYFTRYAARYTAPGSDPEEGIYAGRLDLGVPRYGQPGHPAYQFVRSALVERLLSRPRLVGLAGELLGGPADVLPRRVAAHHHRGAPPGGAAHIDWDTMSEGSSRVLTLWIPLGDCPPDTGGLVYLEGSHLLPSGAYGPPRSGGCGHLARCRRQPPAGGSAPPGEWERRDLELTARRLGRRWQWADYAAGDVVAHLPRTLHAALDTRTDRMRLSVDARFIRRGDAGDPRWLRPWSPGDVVGG